MGALFLLPSPGTSVCLGPSLSPPRPAPFHDAVATPTALPGLTGQRVNALGKLVLLPGAAFELAAEHLTVVFLFHLPRFSRLRFWGRLWGFFGWGCGMTLVTLGPSPGAQAEDAKTRHPTADAGAEGP